eukprot:49571-Hanusia_phi.AAC.1
MRLVGSRAFLIGGLTKNHVTGLTTISKDVYQFDLPDHRWTKLSLTGELAVDRFMYGTAVRGEQIYIYGGVSYSAVAGVSMVYERCGCVTCLQAYFRDLFILDTSNATWRAVETRGYPPPPLEGPSMAFIDNDLFMFGGYNPVDGYLNKLFVLDARSMTWTQKRTQGATPVPYDIYQMLNLDGKIIWFGRGSVQGVLLLEFVMPSDGCVESANDMFLFDGKKLEWTQLNVAGQSPTLKSDYVMEAIGNEIFVYGGENVSNSAGLSSCPFFKSIDSTC